MLIEANLVFRVLEHGSFTRDEGFSLVWRPLSYGYCCASMPARQRLGDPRVRRFAAGSEVVAAVVGDGLELAHALEPGKPARDPGGSCDFRVRPRGWPRLGRETVLDDSHQMIPKVCHTIPKISV